MKRDALFRWIDQYLEVGRYGDYSPIGLQVEGAPEVTKVALGVSAHLQLIEEAAAWGAQAILVHHGFFWPGEPQVITGWRKRRIKALMVHDLSLGSYHLPLDGHAEVGNNAQICDVLGLPKDTRVPFAKAKGADIGLLARYEAPLPLAQVLERVEAAFGTLGTAFLHGPSEVQSVGVVSGGGAGYFEEAAARGVHLFLTGEPREPTMAEAQEMGLHFLAAGHYRTETLGIQALGARLAQEHGLEVRFFDIPNPV
jgi:dinuclear metal center YbgI/SA1388 family protein